MRLRCTQPVGAAGTERENRMWKRSCAGRDSGESTAAFGMAAESRAPRVAFLASLLGVLLACAACGGGKPSTASTTTTASAAASGPATPAAQTVWLCFPGRAPDPCRGNLDTTVVRPGGRSTVERPTPAAHPSVDCFYVYPTVSDQPTGNANLTIEPAETQVAATQAAPFSRVCRVFAPMYRQITNRGLTDPGLHARPLLAYDDVVKAWRSYLARDNDGRGVILVGHSQGAYILKELVKREIDPSASERRLLVSAILLGGDVVVRNGSRTGGSFRHVPACASTTETGCVVAYSSYNSRPPANSRFGRVASPSEHVLCVNPADPAGGSAPITPLLPAAEAMLLTGLVSARPATPWVALAGLFRASCTRNSAVSWLQVGVSPTAGRSRATAGALLKTITGFLGPRWGLHVVDLNIALADLLVLAGQEVRAYTAAH
jgi:hypothetical protein